MKKRDKTIIVIVLIIFFAICVFLIPKKYEITINYSESLPYNFVIVKKGLTPSKRDQVFVFYVRNNEMLGVDKIKFIKLVGGLPGDKIEVKGGDFISNGKILKGEELGDDEMYHAIRFLEIVDPNQLEKKKRRLTNKEAFVGGKKIGVVKPFSKKIFAELEFYKNDKIKDSRIFPVSKFSLHSIKAENIPSGKFFSYTPHKDSFDSRYQEIGLIDEKDIIGTAIVAF
jgi:signal peptidase I